MLIFLNKKLFFIPFIFDSLTVSYNIILLNTYFLQIEDILVTDAVDGVIYSNTPSYDSKDIKEDIVVEPKIKESDSFELTREDIISKDAEITRLQEFSNSSSEGSLNTEKETATTDTRESETETDNTKDIEKVNKQSVNAPEISIPTIVIASQELPTGDNPLPSTQPKRPTPPKIPPQPSVNNYKIGDASSTTTTSETPIMQDSVSDVKDNKKSPPQIPPQPVAPPRKKRQQKKVWYNQIELRVRCEPRIPTNIPDNV